jgi:septal ring factor EnvC (AmiA/AmiB activator)
MRKAAQKIHRCNCRTFAAVMRRSSGGAHARLDERAGHLGDSAAGLQEQEQEQEQEHEQEHEQEPRSLRQRVSLAAAELLNSHTAEHEQEAIITQLQRSYNQQRMDLRAQLGLGPDDDDAADVRHAKRVQDLHDQIAHFEVARGSATPALEHADAEIAAVRKGGDAVAAEMAESEAALEAAEQRQPVLNRGLASLRDQVADQEAQLRAQQGQLSEMETAANIAQERRAAAQAEAAAAAAAKKARRTSSLSPDAAASLLEMLDGRMKGVSLSGRAQFCRYRCVAHARVLLTAVGETLHAREREAGALSRTVARERAERALLSAAVDGCSV